jgi:hypothetical protein
MTLKALLAGVAGAAMVAAAGTSSAAVIFETGADGPANKNVEWTLDDGLDDTVNGFIKNTAIGVVAEADDGELITTDDHGVVWVTPVDGGFKTLTFSLVGFGFESFEVDLKDPTGGNPTWSVTFETDDGSTQTFNNFNGGFVSAYTDDGSLIQTVTFTTNTDITGVGQVRFGGIDGAVIPEPSSWALMIIGFGGVGALLRQRRRSLVAI